MQNVWLTWVKRLHVAVEETDVHASHVDDVEERRDDHAPHSQQHPDQNVDREHQVRQQEQVTPVRKEEMLQNTILCCSNTGKKTPISIKDNVKQ